MGELFGKKQRPWFALTNASLSPRLQPYLGGIVNLVGRDLVRDKRQKSGAI
jgi:hypothetical protein